MSRKIVLCIVGSTGSGKDTVRKILIKSGAYVPIVSLTDRPMRVEDKNKREHKFVSKDKF